MKKIPAFCTLFFLLCIVYTCEKSGEITIKDDSAFEFFFIDSVSLALSTVHVDSIVTQGTASLMAGRYHAPLLGKVSVRSFFGFSPGKKVKPDKKDTFDSLGLIIYPYRKTYGSGNDQKINVHRINQKFTPPKNVFYQFDQLSFDKKPLGSFILEEDEDETDSIFVKLDPTFGQEMFQKAVNDNILDSDKKFREYLSGFVLIPEDPSANFVNAIPFDQKNVKLKLFYRKPTSNTVSKLNYEFSTAKTKNHFNQILRETTSGSLLNRIVSAKELTSAQTGGITFIQGSSALVTKISVPYTQNIKAAFKNTLVNSAILEIVPLHKSFSSQVPLPNELALIYLGPFDNIDDILKQPEQSLLTKGILTKGKLIHDPELGQGTRYEINVTNYIKNMIDNGILNDKHFYLMLPVTDMKSDIRTLAIDASIIKTKLKIYLSKYNK